MTRSNELDAWLAESRAWAERALDRFMPLEDTHPRELSSAMRYAVFGGGKRLRPALVRLVARGYGGDESAAERPAVAIELIHSYSLVHDDLPCMDDDDLRRGRPTCHIAFDEATAVLAGDGLQTLAFELLAGFDARPDAAAELVRVLAEAAGPAGMVGGQMLDLSIELGRERTLESIQDMHARKTGALFRAAAELGAIAAGASNDERGLAREFGRTLGLAFQAVDDLLDVTGDVRTLGKTPGKDAVLERATLAAAVGLEEGERRAQGLAQDCQRAVEALGWTDAALAHERVEFVVERKA